MAAALDTLSQKEKTMKEKQALIICGLKNSMRKLSVIKITEI